MLLRASDSSSSNWEIEERCWKTFQKVALGFWSLELQLKSFPFLWGIGSPAPGWPKQITFWSEFLSSLDGRNRVSCLRQIPKLVVPPSPSSYIPPSFDPWIPQQSWSRFPSFSFCPTPQFAGLEPLSGRLVSHPFIARSPEKQ